MQMAAMFRDISERKRSEQVVRQREAAIEESINGFAMADMEGRLTYVNPAFLNMWGLERLEQAVGRSATELWTSPEEAGEVIAAVLRDGQWVGEAEAVRADEEPFQAQLVASVVNDDRGRPYCLQAWFLDVSERHRAEAERRGLEAQLRQAQKMEAVGQLAGGVAHDFNNLLQVINGYADMALRDTASDHPSRGCLSEVIRAGERAATLVRQLLTFSRRQIMRPESLDLNDVIADVLKLLRRVIGEHIRLDFVPGHELGIVHADRGMMEQVLMNLCVNARDAMPQGGRLIIETENVRIDEKYRENHPWAVPGRYVLVGVTDTGLGMDAGTLDRIFEPFFSTKEPGRGTGLGLATVYGIVKQHEGLIRAYSEPAKGTAFRVYLPITERAVSEASPNVDGPIPGGNETILVAEDDPMVLSLATRLLERAGYSVVAARDGAEAVAEFRRRRDRIDAVLLDVVMPGLGGREALEQIRLVAPDVRALFASGYSASAIHTGFVLDPGLRVIQKPLGREDLLRAVRSVLDEPPS
jgi:PAS domain S-box-containing protein